MLGDNTTIRATHYGSIVVQNLKIDALHTTTLRYSQLSIGELNDQGNITIFADDRCIVRDYTTVLITGTKNGKLFQVDSNTNTVTGDALLTNVRRNPNISLDESKRWHQRHAHLHPAALKSLIDGYTHDGKLCEVCMLAKHQRKIIRVPVQRTTTPFELVHSDTCGPFTTESFEKALHFIIFVDDYSRYTHVYILLDKKAETCIQAFQHFQAKLDNWGYDIKRFRCDNGRGEYNNRLFRGLLAARGISYEPSPPYTQHKNGLAERTIGVLTQKARAMMQDAKVPAKFWSEAIRTATYLHARTPSRAVNGKSPYEVLHKHMCLKKKAAERSVEAQDVGQRQLVEAQDVRQRGQDVRQDVRQRVQRQLQNAQNADRLDTENAQNADTQNAQNVNIDKPPLHHLRRFGCIAYKLIPKDLRVDNKMGARAKRCMFTGYVRSATGIWRLWDIESRRIVECSDVRFDEDSTAYIQDLKNEDPLSLPPEEPIYEEVQIEPLAAMAPDEATARTPDEVVAARTREPVQAMGDTERTREPVQAMGDTDREKIQEPEHAVDSALRRSKRTKKWKANVLLADTDHMPDTGPPPKDTDPRSYREAMACDLRKQWQEAMRQEYASLKKNNTFTAVQESEVTSDPIDCKWVYKTKTNPNGTLRYKARLVIRGFKQIEGVNFDETYAPVGNMSTLRYLLSFVAKNEWKMDHLDVVTAFLNPKIDTEVFMQQPAGIEWLERKLATDAIDFIEPPESTEPPTREQYILRLNKALYGLRQAPRLWHQTIDSFLLSIGFHRSNADPNLYIRADGVLLLLYVDDMLVAYADGSSERAIEVRNALMRQYQMSNLGPAKRFLGLDITRLPDGSILLSQQTYINSILKRFGMEDANPAPTPLCHKTRLDIEMSTDREADAAVYQSITGSLMYAATSTRPDIAYAVAALCRYNSRPYVTHMTAAKRVLRYLKGTANIGLVFPASAPIDTGSLASGSTGVLHGYTDSDFAGDRADRKSQGGYFFRAHGGPIDWQSKKQLLVATSTTEAEYVACSEATRKARCLIQLHKDVTGELVVPPIYCDSNGALKNIWSGVSSAKTKHIDIRFHDSRELHAQGIVKFDYVSTDDNLADIMTKALAPERHHRLVQSMGLRRGC